MGDLIENKALSFTEPAGLFDDVAMLQDFISSMYQKQDAKIHKEKEEEEEEEEEEDLIETDNSVMAPNHSSNMNDLSAATDGPVEVFDDVAMLQDFISSMYQKQDAKIHKEEEEEEEDLIETDNSVMA